MNNTNYQKLARNAAKLHQDYECAADKLFRTQRLNVVHVRPKKRGLWQSWNHIVNYCLDTDYELSVKTTTIGTIAAAAAIALLIGLLNSLGPEFLPGTY